MPTQSVLTVRPGCAGQCGVLIKSKMGAASGRTCLVVDEMVWAAHGAMVRRSLEDAGLPYFEHLLPPGEGSKSLREVERLYHALASKNMGRDGWIMAVGGGVVSDLAGFVAATWMRGIEWVIVPTSLEAMVDAAIGGKTGINLPAGKNLVGAFHHPSVVIADPELLRTLSPRDVRAGMAESVKHALLSGEEFFLWHEQNAQRVVGLDQDVLVELIRRNLEIKSGIVASDPLERQFDQQPVSRQAGKTIGRAALNLGHTLGHAIENASEYSLRHGECVGLGLIAACLLSQRHAGLKPDVTARVSELLLRLGLPVEFPGGLSASAVAKAMGSDKKRRGDRLHFVLLHDFGKPVIVDQISAKEIERLVEDGLAIGGS